MRVRSLLDVSVLLPLIDEDHDFYSDAHAWARSTGGVRWASCAITENGFVRILSQPSYPNCVSLRRACHLLAKAIELTDHQFWPDDISILDETMIRRERLVGHRQITDAYLLALAVKNAGALVTFDRGVPLDAVVGARAEHVVVPGG